MFDLYDLCRGVNRIGMGESLCFFKTRKKARLLAKKLNAKK